MGVSAVASGPAHIILNVDDFGRAQAINVAVIQAYGAALLISASLMIAAISQGEKKCYNSHRIMIGSRMATWGVPNDRDSGDIAH